MQQDTTLHCGHAGKSGDGVCVAVAITDKTFCSEFASVCGPEGVAAYDDCATDFAAMAKGETGATGGDNQECRMYHLGVARTTDTKFHCGHASSTGEGVCIPEAITADNFCSVFDEVCADESVAYSDCAADFTTHAVGNAGAVGGDSQECRIYHLGVARSTDASVHCPHAAKDGDGVCAAQTAVTSTNFCTKFDSICGSITTPYTNCSNDFAAFDSGDSDEEGDTQTCRIYYLGLAATNDTSINCANAAEKGGTTCAADTASSDSSISSLDVFSYTNAATEFIVTFVIAFVLMEYFLYVKVVEEFKPNTKSNDSSTDDDVEANQGKNKNKNKKEIVEFEVKKENPILDLNESGYLEVDEPKKAEPEREEAYGF